MRGQKFCQAGPSIAREGGRPRVGALADTPLYEGQTSIAVLPFTNMSGDPEQEHFSDGITEDTITELSRFRNMFVIASNSSFSYKGKSVKVGIIAPRIGCRIHPGGQCPPNRSAG